MGTPFSSKRVNEPIQSGEILFEFEIVTGQQRGSILLVYLQVFVTVQVPKEFAKHECNFL